MSAENVETVIIDQNNKFVGFLKNIGGSLHITEAQEVINQPSQQPTFQLSTLSNNIIQPANQHQQIGQTQIVQCLNLNGAQVPAVTSHNENTIISYIPANEIDLETQTLSKPVANHLHVADNSPHSEIVMQNGTLDLEATKVSLGQQFSNMVFATIHSPIVGGPSQDQHQQITYESVSVEIPQVDYQKPKTTCQYFCVGTLEELEEKIRKHSEETFSHFVVAKKTKGFGAIVPNIDTTSKFRIHWQSRDLTSTEECAVQIPYEGTPFVYIGEKAYMCHLGRSKAAKNKEAKETATSSATPPDNQVKKHRSRLTKKQGCPAKIFVKHIAKFPEFSIPNNSEYQRTQTSQKLRKALVSGNVPLVHVMNYIGTLPDIAEHTNHEIGESTPVREPIDMVIREKIIELAWKYGDGVLPSQIKDSLESFVENELFKDKTPPSRQRRRFYPSERDIANYIYKAKLLTKISLHEINILSNQINKLHKDHPDLRIFFDLEIDGVNANPSTFSEDISLKYSTATLLNENRIVFGCQSPDQRRLLSRYGKQAVLLEISREANTPFPVYGVLVPTNVDYQLVYLFMVQVRNVKCIRDGIRSLVEWNPEWKPKFLSVDHVKDAAWKHLEIFEEFFPECHIYINNESRQKAWTQWLENPFNSTSVHGNNVILYSKLEAIATSYTEETLNKAAQDLEDSEIWKLSENLREWFSSEWLSEAKRWVAGYRHEEHISMLHLPDTRLDDLQPIRDSHYTCIKSKKVGDFVRDYITHLIPQSYQRYVQRNITDYRIQYAASKSSSITPSYMLNKPCCVLEHLRNQVSNNGSAEYTVSLVQPGHFVVHDKKSGDVPYIVLFGDGVTTPCCGCIDWLKYKIPCSHMVAIFHGFQSWDTLSPIYINNPIFTLDFMAFDKTHVEELMNTPPKPIELSQVIPIKSKEKVIDKTVSEANENSEIVTPQNMSVNKLLPLVSSPTKQIVLPLPVASRGMMEVLTGRQQQQQTNINRTATPYEESATCENVCQELSNVIKRVDDPSMLKKVQSNLQFVLNDVKMELSKFPSPPQSRKSDNDVVIVVGDLSSSGGGDGQNNKRTRDQNTTVCSSNNGSWVTKESKAERDGVSDSKKSKMATTVMEHHLDDDTMESDVWLHDAELEIKLYTRHRDEILNKEIVSHDVIVCAQKVLRHQFHDVTGFTDPNLLEMLTPAARFGTEKKVLQLHSVEGGRHWATSARVGQDIRIFCCTLSSKPAIMQQVLKLSEVEGGSDGVGDNILFIERSEKSTEHCMKNCSLQAIAYCVAFAFDIEARNMLFDEAELRAHFAECLEDMCFSMFPSLKT